MCPTSHKSLTFSEHCATHGMNVNGPTVTYFETSNSSYLFRGETLYCLSGTFAGKSVENACLYLPVEAGFSVIVYVDGESFLRTTAVTEIRNF